MNSREKRAKAIKDAGPEGRKLIREWEARTVDSPCVYCGMPAIHAKGHPVDHFIPICRGGKHEVSNLRRACIMCNGKKSAQLWPE